MTEGDSWQGYSRFIGLGIHVWTAPWELICLCKVSCSHYRAGCTSQDEKQDRKEPCSHSLIPGCCCHLSHDIACSMSAGMTQCRPAHT